MMYNGSALVCGASILGHFPVSTASRCNEIGLISPAEARGFESHHFGGHLCALLLLPDAEARYSVGNAGPGVVNTLFFPRDHVLLSHGTTIGSRNEMASRRRISSMTETLARSLHFPDVSECCPFFYVSATPSTVVFEP
jgi:hypothetical protein